MRISRDANVAWVDRGERVVLLVLDSQVERTPISLSSSASDIWRRLDAGQDYDELCASIANDYNLELDFARTAVRAFVDSLIEHRAVNVA